MTTDAELEGASAVLAWAVEQSSAELIDIARAGGVVLTTARKWLEGYSCPSADQWLAALEACGYEVEVVPKED